MPQKVHKFAALWDVRYKNTLRLVEAYVTKGLFNSIEKKWEKKHKCTIKIEADANLPLLSFNFFDKKGEKISI